jgi:L-ascorbate metabolism protein UlaG (beta-lactamase superfamily)
VIDPGVYSASFTPSSNIDAVVVTHEHSDHFDPEKIAAIRSLNPNVVIFTTDKVASQIDGAQVPKTGEKIVVGNFTLEFFGHDHASIVSGVVPCDNFGVVVNDTLVNPGDSFELPPVRPQILAAPVSAPWLKVEETMEYVAATQPVKVFPMHTALLSQIGQDITYNWLRKGCHEVGVEFIDLQPGESLEI